MQVRLTALLPAPGASRRGEKMSYKEDCRKGKMVLLTIPPILDKGFYLTDCKKCGKWTEVDSTGLCLGCAMTENPELKARVEKYREQA